MRIRIKMCGLRDAEMALSACKVGADALGFVHHEASPRYCSPAQTAAIVRQLPAWVTSCSLIVHQLPEVACQMATEAGVDCIQYYGSLEQYAELRERWGSNLLFACSDFELATDVLAQFPDARLLWDAATPALGGAGVLADWQRAARLAQRTHLSLAGGLCAENLGDAVREVRPWALDVSSGIERQRGRKCPERMRDFALAVRRAEDEIIGGMLLS